MAPRFSVLLPTHNRADVVSFAIASVLAQTERSFELLIVGDGCTDDTAGVVATFDDARIRWLDLPKAPHFGYANRNVALRQATGELVAFAAHDDLLFPDHLATLASRLEETKAEWIYSRPLLASPRGTVVPLSGNLGNADELQHFLHVDNFIPASCIVHRRACLETCGYWPEDLARGGDWHLWRRIVGGGRDNFAYHPVPTMLHFKAIWRERFDPAATALFALADGADWWPPALKVEVDAGRPEQVAFSRLLAGPDAGWIADARRAVATVVERLAWDHTMKCLPASRPQPAEIAVLEGLLSQREAEIAALTDAIERLGHEAGAVRAPLRALPPPGFLEQAYLAANPDVAAAVESGRLPSGYDHWLRFGRREGRPLSPAGTDEP